MDLLAQQTTGLVAPDISVLLAYGPLGAIAAVLFYFVIRYGSRLAEGHVAFMATAKDCMNQQTKTLESLSSTMRNHESHCQKLPRMIAHIAEAGKAATECPDVHRHLDRCIDEKDR